MYHEGIVIKNHDIPELHIATAGTCITNAALYPDVHVITHKNISCYFHYHEHHHYLSSRQ